MKPLLELTTGGIIHRLFQETNEQKFDETCVLLSRRLLFRKRFYHNPFPAGEYKLYLYIDKNTFGGVIYRKFFDDRIYTVNNTHEIIGTISIYIEGNDVTFKKRNRIKGHSSGFVRELACMTLKVMSLHVVPQIT